jgi:FtsP/CotA-like multicopper oxidase with cupredoxin domain
MLIYYPAFLINGKQTIEYPDFKPGEKVRVRVINGGASTSLDDFWGEDPVLVSSDGHDVVPVVKTRHLLVSQNL